MRITAISDIHGSLIPIEPTDLLIIAGDWCPLEIQNTIWYMREWIDTCLLPWFKEIPANKIVFIAGNHEFICDPNFIQIPVENAPYITFSKNILHPSLKKHGLLHKVTYLESSSVKYKGYKIFGIPYVDGCRGWAFSQGDVRGSYKLIPKCDILITHQPPLFGGVGRTVVDGIEYELGSWSLLEAIRDKKPKYLFCGHIHNGNHEEQIYHHSDDKQTHIINCAIKNEDYQIFYPIQVINVPDLDI